MRRLVAWAREPGRTLVFTSHDVDEVAESADRVVVVGRGGVLAAGSVDQVLSSASRLAEVGLAPPLTVRLAAALAGADAAGGRCRVRRGGRRGEAADRRRPGGVVAASVGAPGLAGSGRVGVREPLVDLPERRATTCRATRSCTGVDARLKLVATVVFAVSLFAVERWTGLGVLGLALAAGFVLARVPPGYLWRGLRPLTVLLVLTFVLQLFGYPGSPCSAWDR